MKRYSSLLVALCVLVATAALAQAQAQDPPASSTGTTTQPAPSTTAPSTASPSVPDAPAVTQEPAQTAPPARPKVQPGVPAAELQKLDFLKGTWNSKMTMPDGTVSTGKAKFGPAFSGMVLEGDHSYTMGGKPMTGRTIWGWDAEKQQYQLVWVNSMGSDAKLYYGTFPNETSLSFFTTYMMGSKAVTEKLAFSFPDKNTYVFTVENDASGTMSKVMEETATRGSANATAAKSGAKTTKPASKPATASSGKKKAG
ncbi:MAG TPA: DUF1579 family protein [Candidatus Eisenbacteria bacterium]|nr:DUF1579 family protein [Candidatus Eisenbacteria bacterium]